MNDHGSDQGRAMPRWPTLRCAGRLPTRRMSTGLDGSCGNLHQQLPITPGHCEDRSVIGYPGLGDHDIDALLAQQAVQLGNKAVAAVDQIRWDQGGGRFDQQVDIAPAPCRVQARTEEPDG